MRLQGELTGLLHCSSSKEALLIHRWIPVSIIVKLACKMVHEKVGGHAPPVPMSAGGEIRGGGGGGGAGCPPKFEGGGG